MVINLPKPETPTAVIPQSILELSARRPRVIVGNDHVYVVPVRRILDRPDMGDWVGSEAMVRYLQFLSGLNEAARNKKNTDECHVSETVQNILRLLDTLKEWIADIPPIATPMRFGNRAFKTWHTRLEERAEDLHKTILPFPQHTAIPELIPYFSTSFGHHIRLDYGSGHEMCFLAWLCCLNVMDVIKEVDFQAVVCRVFAKYLDLVRAIQTTYMLEPAGSHGVWGLDDYQFLPYLFGSAQLMDHPRLKPKSVLQKDSVDHFSKDFLYFRAIQFINEVKKGPFFEHSPILYDISGVALWSKVNTGMIKMYFAEVLQKFPVVQHIPFGSLLPFTEALPITEAAETVMPSVS